MPIIFCLHQTVSVFGCKAIFCSGGGMYKSLSKYQLPMIGCDCEVWSVVTLATVSLCSLLTGVTHKMSDHLLWVVPIQYTYITQQVPCTSSTGDKWALCYRRLSGVIVSGCLEEILAYDGHMYPHSAAAVVPLPERNYENYDGGWRIWRIEMVNWAEWHNLHSG